MILRIDAG